jgi:aspartate racemase
MKTIGLIGGMSWESTATYYRVINQTVADTLGGLHSARLVLASVDFAEIADLQAAGDWKAAGKAMAAAARQVVAAGADFLVLCTNTMHRVADRVEAATGKPLLHIADVTADAVRAMGIHTVGLLGTLYTLEHDFYRGRLEERHGLEVLVPEAEERGALHAIIFDELCRGEVRDASAKRFLAAIEDLVARGAGGMVFGCTEIGLLVQPDDVAVPTFDTAVLHARAAALMAVGA